MQFIARLLNASGCKQMIKVFYRDNKNGKLYFEKTSTVAVSGAQKWLKGMLSELGEKPDRFVFVRAEDMGLEDS